MLDPHKRSHPRPLKGEPRGQEAPLQGQGRHPTTPPTMASAMEWRGNRRGKAAGRPAEGGTACTQRVPEGGEEVRRAVMEAAQRTEVAAGGARHREALHGEENAKISTGMG